MTFQKTILVDISFVATEKLGSVVYRYFAVPNLETMLSVLRQDFLHYDGRALQLNDLEKLEEVGVIRLRPKLKPITIGETKIKLLFLDFREIPYFYPVLNEIAWPVQEKLCLVFSQTLDKELPAPL